MSPMTPEAMALSGELAQALGQAIPADADFVLPSRSRGGRVYPMVRTPEGYAVHQGEGCEGEIFNGVLGCWHARENNMTTKEIALRPDLVPQLIEFTDDQLKTIADVVCVDADGNRAPEQFVSLFVGACRQSGLNPFLKQIYALKVKGKWQMYVGIDGYRVISERTGLDQGMDGPQWSDDGREWFDYPMGPDPKFCRVGIWRKGVPRAFVAVVQMAAYRQSHGRWTDDAPGMLAIRAEALARRRAFPANTAVIPHGAILDEPPEDAYPEAIDGAFRDVTEEAPIAPAHEEGPEPHAAEAASPEVESREAASAPAPSPNKAPSFPSYRGWVKERIEAAGHHADSIEAEAGREYSNRSFGQLTAAECQSLASKFGVNVPLPGQPSLIA